MPTPSAKSMLPVLQTILNNAEQRAQTWASKRHSIAIDEKSAGQFATEADRDLETFIRDQLTRAFSSSAIIGEEFGGTLSTSEIGWAIDPIDGTTNFIIGLPIWGVSIGYLEDGESTLEGIALPDLGLTLVAARNEGLFVNQVPIKIAPPPIRVKNISLGENDFEPGTATDLRAEQFRAEGYSVVRYRCAVLSLAMSALGRLDGYIERGCGLWDIAAAAVICSEAGMRVQTSRLSPGRYAIDARWSSI
jgi:myo-inositol-1(or 4)-monophosphatase